MAKEKQKAEILKPFSIKHYQFFPCVFNDSKLGGYKYFLLIRNSRGIVYQEVDSPRFKSKDEAIKFAESNKVQSYVIG